MVKPSVSLKAIEACWDELVRLAASIEAGFVTADVALARFGSAAAAGDPLHRAAEHLGRLLRTIFLCDYLAHEAFRREMHRILDHAESVHQLQRAIYYGPIPTRRGRRHEEALALSGSLTLLTNITVAWTTYRVQEVLRRWASEQTVSQGKIAPDWIRYVSPARSELIKCRGVFTFPVEHYAQQLVAASANSRQLARHAH
jgi:TnpA family transposase